VRAKTSETASASSGSTSSEMRSQDATFFDMGTEYSKVTCLKRY
jgi:hypothetical protein